MGNSSTESTSTLRLQRCTKKVPFENILSEKTPVMLALFWGCCAAFINGATLPKVGAKEELFEYHTVHNCGVGIWPTRVLLAKILIKVQAQFSNLWWIPLYMSFKITTLYCGRVKGRWLDSYLCIGCIGCDLWGTVWIVLMKLFSMLCQNYADWV